MQRARVGTFDFRPDPQNDLQVGRSFVPASLRAFASSREIDVTRSREAAKGKRCGLGPRPDNLDLVERVNDRPPDRREQPSTFPPVTRCTKRGHRETTDEQTECHGLPKRLRHTPSKSQVGRLLVSLRVFASSRETDVTRRREAAKGKKRELGVRPDNLDLVERAHDRPPDRREQASTFPPITCRAERRGGRETTDEQTENGCFPE